MFMAEQNEKIVALYVRVSTGYQTVENLLTTKNLPRLMKNP